MLSTVQHKEKSARALVCFTGGRRECSQAYQPVCTGSQMHTRLCGPAVSHSQMPQCPSTTSTHRPLGKSTLSFDSVSREVAQRKTQPEGGWPSRGLVDFEDSSVLESIHGRAGLTLQRWFVVLNDQYALYKSVLERAAMGRHRDRFLILCPAGCSTPMNS